MDESSPKRIILSRSALAAMRDHIVGGMIRR